MRAQWVFTRHLQFDLRYDDKMTVHEKLCSGRRSPGDGGPAAENPDAPVWRAIRALLVDVKMPIDQKIRNTPPPIPACDARFNHLLEERGRVARELNRLDAASAQGVSACRSLEAIEDFLASSAFIDDRAAADLRGALHEEFAALKFIAETGAETGAGRSR